MINFIIVNLKGVLAQSEKVSEIFFLHFFLQIVVDTLSRQPVLELIGIMSSSDARCAPSFVEVLKSVSPMLRQKMIKMFLGFNQVIGIDGNFTYTKTVYPFFGRK